MAELRMMTSGRARRAAGFERVAVVAIALAACRSSSADPGSDVGPKLTPPQGWAALPQLADAASGAAKHAGISVDRAEAWGEPARGCYAAYVGVGGASGPAAAVAQQMVASLSADPALAGIAIHDVVKPDGAGGASGVLELGFERGLYRGKLRAQIVGDGHVRVLACFWNQREPAACERACTDLFGSMP